MIVVGIDESAPGRAAVVWSVRRAAVTGDLVMIIHVLDDEWGVMGTRLLQELRTEAGETLAREREFARSVDSGVRVDSVLLSGNPMLELARASADADLVVVGTHKTGYVRGRIFGSRSLQLAAASWTPVAIVPQSPGRSRSGIVVGVDGSPASLAAVTFAADEANRWDQELILVGAWTGIAREQTVDGAPPQTDVLIKSAVEEALREARGRAQELCRSQRIRVRQVNRPAAEILVEASAAATMLVVGSSRRVDAPTTLGSVAHDVLLNIVTPTVVVHGEHAQPLRTTESGRRLMFNVAPNEVAPETT